MQAEPERRWTSSEMSVRLCCAPSQARGALLRHVAIGQVRVDDGGTFRLADAPPAPPAPGDAIHTLLERTPVQEWTPYGIATELPELKLTEDQVLDHLVTLARARRIELWASLPTLMEAPDGN